MDNIPQTQKVAVYYRNSDVRIEERPVPKIGPGELLVKIRRLRHLRQRRPGVVPHQEGPDRPGARGRRRDRPHRRRRHAVPRGPARRRLAPRPLQHVPLLPLGATTPPATRCTRRTSIRAGSPSTSGCRALQADRGVFPLPDNVSFEEGSFFEPLGVRRPRAAVGEPAAGPDGGGLRGGHLGHPPHRPGQGPGRGPDRRDGPDAGAPGHGPALRRRRGLRRPRRRARPCPRGQRRPRGRPRDRLRRGPRALQAGPGLGRRRRHDPLLSPRPTPAWNCPCR